MASSREYEGRNIKKAIQNASRALDIDDDEIKYDVVSYGSSGIFGLVGTKKAKIRVRLPKNRNDTRVEAKADQDGGPSSDETPDSFPADSADIQFPEIEREVEKASEPVAGDSQEEPTDNPAHADETDYDNAAPEDDDKPRETVSWDQSEQVGLEVLERIVGFITPEAEIVSRQNRDQIEYDVQGGNTAIIIGKRGQTLEAIQYLAEKIVNKQREDRIRIHIDAGDYMRKRRENLEQIAFRVANKAKRMGRPGSMGQLNPHDRRIVHMALRRDEAVWTKSIGEGHLRKLVVYPKKRPNEAQDNRSR